MGGSGLGFAVRRLDGVEPTPALTIAESIALCVQEEWGRWLEGHPARGVTRDWISCDHPDALIQIGGSLGHRSPIEGDLFFWFYDGVHWPVQLAKHWLRLALATGRAELERTLAQHGYAPAGGWPSLGDSFYRGDARYVSDGGRIGRRIGDGSVIEWVLDAHGEYELPNGTYDELDATSRARFDEVARERRCACPICEAIDRSFEHVSRAALHVDPAWTVDAIDSFSHGLIAGRVRHADGRALLLLGDDGLHTGYVMVGAPQMTGPWTTRRPAALEAADRVAMAAYDSRDDTLVLWTAAYRESQPPRFDGEGLLVSRDFGATFTRQLPMGLPEPPEKLIQARDARAEVFARCAGALYRSGDAGRTWSRLGDFPHEHLREIHAPGAGGVLLAMLGEHQNERLLRSTDGGATFEAVALPAVGDMPYMVCGRGPGLVVLTVNVQTTDQAVPIGAALLRSTDGGATWTVLRTGLCDVGVYSWLAIDRGGRWYWGAPEDQGQEHVVDVSDDDGQSWTRHRMINPDLVFCDEDAVWLAKQRTLMRLAPTKPGQRPGSGR